MFRLAEFDERCSVYRQMSETASRTITRAIDGWVNTVYDIEEIYWMYFGAESGSDFFAGISEYLPLSSVRPVLMNSFGEKSSGCGKRWMTPQNTIHSTFSRSMFST